MREIKFRGYNTDRNEWIYGYLIENGEYFTIGGGCIVDPESVGQYTSLKDKNDVEIYEGDIVNWFTSKALTIIFRNGSFIVNDNKENDDLRWLCKEEVEVIGNIYENPELLKKY